MKQPLFPGAGILLLAILWFHLPSATAQGTATAHTHPLLACLDAWPIENFEGSEWEKANFQGTPGFFEMSPGPNVPFPHGGWMKADEDNQAYEARLLGCLPVKFVKGGWRITAPTHHVIWDPSKSYPSELQDWNDWLQETGTRKRPSEVADLVIMARGYEAAQQPEMARALAEKALQFIPNEEKLMRQVQYRYCKWQYETALDQWLASSDWQQLESALNQLLKGAPVHWPGHAFVRDLIGRIPTADKIPEGVPQDLQGALFSAFYGNGRAINRMPLGSWLLFPPSEWISFKGAGSGSEDRLVCLLDHGPAVLPLLTALIQDETLCAQIIPSKSSPAPVKNPYLKVWKNDNFSRRPATTGELAYELLSQTRLQRSSTGETKDSFVNEFEEWRALLQDKSQEEKLVLAATLGDLNTQAMSVYGLIDLGYPGPWEDIENVLIEDLRKNRRDSFALQQMLRLRGKDALPFIERIEVSVDRLSPSLKQRIRDDLSNITLAEVFETWPEHRGRLFETNLASRKAVYCSTPTLVLASSLKEAAAHPKYAADLIDLAMEAWQRPTKPQNMGWPGIHDSFERCRETMQSLLESPVAYPLPAQARGDGLQVRNSAHSLACLMYLAATSSTGKILHNPGYSLLGREWMEILTADCQKLIADKSPIQLSGLYAYIRDLSFLDGNAHKELLMEIGQWTPGDFPEKWAALSLSQRKFAALKFQSDLPPPLVQLRNTVRQTSGEILVRETEQAPDDLAHQSQQWIAQKMQYGEAACSLLTWRSGLGGVEVENQAFEDPALISPKIADYLAKSFQEKPASTSLIVISARCHDKSHLWVIDPATDNGDRFAKEFEYWSTSQVQRPLAQFSVWMCGVTKEMLPKTAGP